MAEYVPVHNSPAHDIRPKRHSFFAKQQGHLCESATCFLALSCPGLPIFFSSSLHLLPPRPSPLQATLSKNKNRVSIPLRAHVRGGKICGPIARCTSLRTTLSAFAFIALSFATCTPVPFSPLPRGLAASRQRHDGRMCRGVAAHPATRKGR